MWSAVSSRARRAMAEEHSHTSGFLLGEPTPLCSSMSITVSISTSRCNSSAKYSNNSLKNLCSSMSQKSLEILN